MNLAVDNRKNTGGKKTKSLFLSAGDKHQLDAKQCVLTVQLSLNSLILVLHVYSTWSESDTDSVSMCTQLNFTALVLKVAF